MNLLDSPANASRRSARGVSGRQLHALLLLMLIYTCHAIDRGIVSVLVEPIKREFGVSDKVMGFVPLAFSMTFILAVLPIGALIDRVNRVRLLAILLGIWSLMTATAGFASTITLLVASRMGVGAAEAGAQPICLSLLSDTFPARRRGSALGIFYLATGLGSIIAFLGGGVITSAYGWRFTFLMGGLPGLLLVPVLLLTLREPLRGAVDGKVEEDDGTIPSMGMAIRFAATSGPVRLVLLGTLLSSFVLGSFLSWIPALLMREHGFTIKAAGISVAIAGGLIPALGAIVWGFVADHLGREHRERVGLMCAISSAGMAICGLAVTLSTTTTSTLAWLVLFGLFGGGWMAPSLALLIGLTPPRMRGSLLAIAQIFTALGSGFGPFIVGSFSDFFHRLSSGLIIGASVGFGAMLLYLAGVRSAAGRVA
jgi:MFS family permease